MIRVIADRHGPRQIFDLWSISQLPRECGECLALTGSTRDTAEGAAAGPSCLVDERDSRALPRRFRPRRRGLLGRLPRMMLDMLLDAIEERHFRIELRR